MHRSKKIKKIYLKENGFINSYEDFGKPSISKCKNQYFIKYDENQDIIGLIDRYENISTEIDNAIYKKMEYPLINRIYTDFEWLDKERFSKVMLQKFKGSMEKEEFKEVKKRMKNLGERNN